MIFKGRIRRKIIKKKNIIYLFIIISLLSGCALLPKKYKVAPDKPHEAPTVYNFKSTPKDDAKLFQMMGLDYFSQKDLAQAQNFLTKAVKLDPKLYLSWYCLGLLNIDNPGGYSYLVKAQETKPDFAPPYYWMAYYHCRLKENKKAISLFRKYIELAKGNPKEEERLKAANEVLRELLSGKEGEALEMILKPARKQ
ncbi:MAG: hypothetical protein NTW18_04975 [Candidatus Omnitrophica bacterium]|nr:hypothetical protein [Candidatus Omnitrophota bacterium]